MTAAHGNHAYEVVSRALDVAIAGVGLIVMSIPLALLGLACRFVTGASGFFTQTRVGIGGRPFRLIKLRTMHTDDPNATNDHIPPAIGFGGALRKLKLDELPQLWNVLQGDMSIVGPRPIVPDEYSEKSHLQRLEVRPGLTGLWQISKARNRPFDANPEYDLYYLEHRSIGLDLWIMWRTGLLVVLGKETELPPHTKRDVRSDR